MKTIVMTGGTSGLGAVTVRQILDDGHKLLLGVRKQSKVSQHTLPLDLTNLTQVRLFAEAVKRALEGTSIHALVLNAGGFARGCTVEGYEATFVVNHRCTISSSGCCGNKCLSEERSF